MELKETANHASTRFEREPSKCESCGEEFGCGAKLEGCWCSELSLGETTRAELRTRFQRCLCRACLERFAAGELDNETRISKGASTG